MSSQKRQRTDSQPKPEKKTSAKEMKRKWKEFDDAVDLVIATDEARRLARAHLSAVAQSIGEAADVRLVNGDEFYTAIHARIEKSGLKGGDELEDFLNAACEL